MTYSQFKTLVSGKKWSVGFLRSDTVPPTQELLDLMDDLGLNLYERFVLRYEWETSK